MITNAATIFIRFVTVAWHNIPVTVLFVSVVQVDIVYYRNCPIKPAMQFQSKQLPVESKLHLPALHCKNVKCFQFTRPSYFFRSRYKTFSSKLKFSHSFILITNIDNLCNFIKGWSPAELNKSMLL